MRAGSLPLFVAAIALCPLAAATEIDLNGLVVHVDDVNGCIVGLVHPMTGQLLSTPADNAGLLDTAYPVEAFAPLRLASRHSVARITHEGSGLRIRYDRLGASRSNVPLPEGQVTAEIALRPAPDGRSAILACRIENHSRRAVPQVLFPDLRGFRPIEGPEGSRLRFGLGAVYPFLQPYHLGADFAPLFYVERGWRAYPPCGYYGLKPLDINSLRWLDYGGHASGLSVFQRKWGTPDCPTVRTQRRESDPTSLRILWEHPVTIEPGASWESGEFWLTPHAGGWAKGIEVYREYVNTVNETRPLPRHVSEGLGFRTAWMMPAIETDPEKAAFRFEDIPEIAADAKEHGLDEVCLWGWCTYSAMPILTRDELGTRDDFLSAARRSAELGVNITPFVSVQIVKNQQAQRYGLEPGNNNWTYHPEMIPNFTPAYSDVHNGVQVPADNEVWRRDVAASLSAWIEAGVTSFSWDVLPTSPSADGRSPVIELLRPIRDHASALQPESTCSGELYDPGAFESASAILDYTWNWVDHLDAGPVLNVLRKPRLNCHVEDGVRTAKLAFADGLYLNVMPRRPDQPNGTSLIRDHPELSKTLKELAALRRRYLPYFTDGVFVGDSILSRPAQSHVSAYQRGDRMLIILLNDTEEPVEARLEAPLDLWFGGKTQYEATVENSQGESIGEVEGAPIGEWTYTTRPLQPLELVFIEIVAS